MSTSASEQPTSNTPILGAGILGFIIFDFVIGTIITVANAFLFITIYRDPCRCLRTPSVFLIANLSVADFFTGIVSYLRAVGWTYKYCGLGNLSILNISQYFIGALSILAAVLTLMAMSYERYIAVIKPLEYPQKITITRAKIAIAVIWINAVIMSVLPASGLKVEFFLLVYCYSHFVIPAIVLTIIYVKIYKTVTLQRQELKDVRASLTVANRRKQLERENRMFMTFLLILFVFYFSFVPYFINVNIFNFCFCRTSFAHYVYYLVANALLSVSSLLDPFMYAWRLPKFNRSFRLCFRLWRNRNVVEPWNGTTSFYQNRANGQPSPAGSRSPGMIEKASKRKEWADKRKATTSVQL
ncbi:hypothetical protein ACROYT_G019441 [Oculina patagonica]